MTFPIFRSLLLAYTIPIICLAATKPRIDGISVSGQTIKLGDRKASVQQSFRDFKITALGNEEVPQADSWVILGSQNEPVANVYFKNDRVKTVYKYWDLAIKEGKATSFVSALSTLISSYTSSYGNQFTIYSNESKEPGVVQKSVTIKYSNRAIVISFYDGYYDKESKQVKSWVNLHETLE